MGSSVYMYATFTAILYLIKAREAVLIQLTSTITKKEEVQTCMDRGTIYIDVYNNIHEHD